VVLQILNIEVKSIKLSEVKECMAKKMPVIHQNIEYKYISACIMRLIDGDWKYSLELMETNRYGVVTASLEKVEVEKDG